MSTINREATIAELMKMTKPFIHWEQVKKMLEAMPDVPDTNVGDMVSRQAAIDTFARDKELLNRVLDDVDVVGNDREKYEWGLGLIESYIADMKDLPSAQPEPQWTPVKMRPMDSGELEYWEDQFGEKLEDEDAVMFDCPMPEDGQEILVSYRKWISMDKCEIDGGCYGLEGNGDWEDIIAWMPLPEPYKEGEDE